MLDEGHNDARNGLLRGLASIGGRTAAATMRPLTGAISAASDVGVGLERRVLAGVLESQELEWIVITTVSSERLRRTLQRLLESDAAGGLIDDIFDSSLFDHFVDRLLRSDALWRLIDEVAQSPSVTAISGQGLGFADQLGGELRTRSRRADGWLERSARRVTHGHPKSPSARSDAGSDSDTDAGQS
jgi:hypothetical protein